MIGVIFRLNSENNCIVHFILKSLSGSVMFTLTQFTLPHILLMANESFSAGFGLEQMHI